VQLAGDPRALLRGGLLAQRVGHRLPGRVALGERLPALAASVAQQLRGDHEHGDHGGRDATVARRRGQRGEEERRREQHRGEPAPARRHEVGDDQLRGDAGERQRRRDVGEEQERPDGDQPRGHEQAAPRQRERQRGEQVADHRALGAGLAAERELQHGGEGEDAAASRSALLGRPVARMPFRPRSEDRAVGVFGDGDVGVLRLAALVRTLVGVGRDGPVQQPGDPARHLDLAAPWLELSGHGATDGNPTQFAPAAAGGHPPSMSCLRLCRHRVSQPRPSCE
jgi:hypothetical protein